jgi:hypothetical protein
MAVPAADVAGWSRLIGHEEERTLCLSRCGFAYALFAETCSILTTAAKAARRLNAK